MKNASELLEEAVYAGNLSENEEERLYSWIESLILAKRKADEYETNKWRTHVNDLKAEAFDAILKSYDEALSEGHMADEVSNIIKKYESGGPYA